MKNHRALFCIALAFAGILSASAAGPTTILSGSSADPSANTQGNPYATADNSTIAGNNYGPSANISGSAGVVRPAFEGVPGPVACGPFAIGLIAGLRRRNKKA